ncbi:DMT family transporter [Patescibacteria group bacterium]|nr:DMT family transporter [Patescibacteria group bacterium]
MLRRYRLVAIFSLLGACFLHRLDIYFFSKLSAVLTTEQLVFLGMLTSALILLPYVKARKELREINKMSWKKMFLFLLAVICGSILSPYFFLGSLKAGSPLNSVLIITLSPIFVVFFGRVILKERIRINSLIGGLILMSGVLYVITQGFTLSNLSITSYELVIAAVTAALATILFRVSVYHLSPAVLTFSRCSIGAIIMFVFVGIIFRENLSSIDWHSLWGLKFELMGFVILIYIVPNILFFYAIENISAISVGLLELSTPIFGVLISVVLLNDSFQSYHVVGVILVVVGLVVTQLRLHRNKSMVELRASHKVIHPHH